ncbi:conserved hypothetical protein [Leishmania infantum JPCM5]|uniref:Uncharacterized protein n=2 Tax=Leishmania infantum TaxID=5671 RepID=A4HZ92_LEIIN|nr:conserved hypothetical protein [Leishmania infantum JPCM5]CAC9486284.1 hypothetical_protein_-_conserved [Leishmania infantum]CAM67825.2 conserved hypothetical protein [Leishmania infantum JPCM5]SUZ41599.1 hypothetical_protein_-_conserved [Leishmania infantum]|eukprot:XP_001465404.2 conserved hypothetical protein [Leishmania infantum JPCM5]
MQTRARSGGTRPLPTATSAASETDSIRTGGSSDSNSPSHGLRRSNLPAPLAPEALSSSLPVSQRLDGASSCPVNRAGRLAPDALRMPTLSPAASPLTVQGRSPPPHQREAYQRRVHPGSGDKGGGKMSLPPPSTPTQAGSAPVDENGDGSGRRGHHNARSSMNSGSSSSSRHERSSNALGLRTNEPAPSMPSMSSRLPAMMQPSKLSTSTTASSNVSTTNPPAQQQPASTATMPTVPTSSSRLASQPDVSLLTVTSPARRCCLVADSSDRSAETTPVSTVQIPLPPRSLPQAPAPAQRPSSTVSATSASNSVTRGTAHQREAEARATAGDGSTSKEAYLRDNPRVRALVNNMYQHVMTTQPEEPLRYLAHLRAGTVPQVPSTHLAPPATQRGEARRTPGQQARTVPQPRQLSSRAHGSAHPPYSHTAEGASTSSASVSSELLRDSGSTCDNDGGHTWAGPLQPTPQQPESAASHGGDVDLTDSFDSGAVSSGVANRPASLTARSDVAAAVRPLRTPPSAPTTSLQSRGGSSGVNAGGRVMPPSIAGTVMHTNASSNAILSGSASSKHGSPQLLQRSGLVTNSLANSGFLSGVAVGSAGHQAGSSGALLQHASGSVSAFRSSGIAAPHLVPSFAGSVSGIERGEATPSDLSSLFSTNSVDLQEFIAEFRLAKEERYGGSVDHPAITLDELACIIECNSFPCADAEVLLDLFDELQPCARYLAGVQNPTRSPPAVSATLKRNSSPQLLHRGLGPRSMSPVSLFNGTVAATAAAESAATGKVRGVGATNSSAVAAMGNNGNATGPAWPPGRVQGAESCVAAAHPPTSVAAKGMSHSHERFADEAQCKGCVTISGRADTKDGKVLVIGSRIADGAPFESSSEGGSYNPYSRCTSDAFTGASTLQRQQGVSQHPYSDGADGEEVPTVPFDTLLARMAYKIQGRYPSEAIRIAFYGMVVDEESAATALESSGRSAGLGVDCAALVANGRGLHGVVSTDSLTPSETTVMGSSSAGMATTGYGTLPSCTVPLSRCITEGLFARLGMVDVTAGEVQRGLRSVGLPIGQDEQRVYECHLEDFARLVRAITAVSERGCSASPANPSLTSLRESYVQRGSSNNFAVCNNSSGGTVPAAPAPWKE